MIDFGHFFNRALGPMGFDVVAGYQTYSGPYNTDTGWPLNLPNASITDKTLILIHFPDFITINDNRVLELEYVEKFYQQHCNRVVVTHWTSDLDRVYSGPINLVKFSNHNYDLARNLAQCFDQWKPILSAEKTRAWQCLNGRITPHRRHVAYKLRELDNGWLSLGTEMPLPEHNYSCYFGCDNVPNFLALDYVYGSAPVNIVTETEYDPPTGIVTEKTLMAFAAQQIPVVIGHRGIVDQCRRMGFDMFDDVVDTSYDNLPNDQRCQAALERNWHLFQQPVDLEPYRQRLERNMIRLLWQLPNSMETHFLAHARALADRLLPGYTS